MTESSKKTEAQDQWSEINARLGLSDEDKIVGWVECPKCGEEHAVDDLQERTGVSLYCDTHDVRVPFPNAFLHRLKDEQKKFGASLKKLDGPVRDKGKDSKEKRFSFGPNKDKSGPEWRFRF